MAKSKKEIEQEKMDSELKQTIRNCLMMNGCNKDLDKKVNYFFRQSKKAKEEK